MTVVIEASTESENMARARAIPGNPGGLFVSTRMDAVGEPRIKPRTHARRSVLVGERRNRSVVVSPSEGNQARRNGRRAIGARHSTDEVGEPSQGPHGGKGAPGNGTVGGNDVRDSEPDRRLNETAADSEAGQGSADGGAETLAHHIDGAFLAEAFHRTRKDGARRSGCRLSSLE